MTDIVTSTADVLAILGGATTFIAAVFTAVRLARCQTVTCCWGAISLVNRPISNPIPHPLDTVPTQAMKRETSLSTTIERENSDGIV